MKIIKKFYPDCPLFPDQTYKILIVDVEGSGKTNALTNLINHQPGIDKIYIYAKDLFEPKYKSLINKNKKKKV